MSDYTYIRDNAGFSSYRDRLRERAVTSIALDIEGEFNLHVYGERFCLLQLSDGKEEAVVDPVTVSAPMLGEFLEDRSLLKITFDSSSDRVLLAKTHGIVMNSILDLKPAVEILEYPRQDLSSVLESTLGVSESGSKKRFQQYNWTRRPIDPEAIEYALRDVRYLVPLKDALLERLAAARQLDRYILENLKRQDRPPEVDRKPGTLRSARFKRLRAEQQRTLETLHEIRERYAKELDLPPNSVIPNDDLFALATGRLEVSRIRGGSRVPERTLEEIRREFGEPGGSLR